MSNLLLKDDQNTALWADLVAETAALTDEDLDFALCVIYSEYVAREQKKATKDGRGAWAGS
jgi:hypothetical protein